MGSVTVDDVLAPSVFETLKANGQALLIDVRTRAEWAFIGLPDLSSLGKRVLTIEWQTYPDGRVDGAFAEKLDAHFRDAGVGKDAELFFICRSGARSRAAAQAMVAQGYTRCHNVADGFEGPLDAERRRGRKAGWKAAGLPWVQD